MKWRTRERDFPRGGSPDPPLTNRRRCASTAGTETRRAVKPVLLSPALRKARAGQVYPPKPEGRRQARRLTSGGRALTSLLAVLALLSAGCEGPNARTGVNQWIKDLVFPPSTAERVIAVQSPLADRRREALQQIVEDKEARRVESVVKLYCLVARTDKDPMVRSAAARGLAVLEGEPVVPALCHVLETDENAYVRADAAAALAHHEEPAAMEALVDALASDASTDVRVAAAGSLSRFKNTRAADALAEAVADRDLAVAHVAWRSLRYMTGQDLPREPEPWHQFLASAEAPFADYGDAPKMPEGESQRPHFRRGLPDFVRSLFEKDPLEEELE